MTLADFITLMVSDCYKYHDTGKDIYNYDIIVGGNGAHYRLKLEDIQIDHDQRTICL